ncbi:MAG: SRPBCC domain-containing protein [Myxococcales bacterium]|nr:SRPBCC domain-containing protein [Myxococcales bacterium]MCB9580311.1 SRPBCC domain-containing protein [Polyangiaceae bacterium]
MTSSVLVALRVKASPERTFDVFTREIAAWWRPDPLFRITSQGDGTLAFEGEAGGKLVTRLADGSVYEIGTITEWRRGERLGFTWKPESVDAERTTRVEVTFEAVGDETRVSVQHFGWLEIPQKHAARHGFPDRVTGQRVGDWWRRSLAALSEVTR